MQLENCVQVIEGNVLFQETIWKQIVDNPELQIIPAANELARLIFEKLNLSLLGGDYIVDPEKTNNDLESIVKSLSKIPDILELVSDSELQSNCQYILMESLTDPLRKSIKAYQRLIFEMAKKVGHDDVLFHGWKVPIKINSLYEVDAESKALSEIFARNVKIAIIDHNLSVDKTQLKDLIIYKKDLTDGIALVPFYKAIIIDKCDYLIRKINYKFQEDKKNYTYAFEFQDSKIDESKELKFFNSFLLKTKLHYGIDLRMTHKDFNSLYEKIITKSIDEFQDYYTVLQFYKDHVKDRSRIANLKEEFNNRCKKKITDSRSSFDKEAVLINQNYFSNNEFSLLISDDSEDYHSINQQLNEIRALQRETGIKNYFPYLKFCEFLKNKIKSGISELKDNESVIQKYIDSMNLALEEAFKAFEWCQDSKFAAFQLPHDEATIKYSNEEQSINLFVASGFMLPINYVKVGHDLKAFEREKDSFKLIMDVHKSISHEKNEIKKIRQEVEKVDRRAIEIIGIFAAIVLFASGSIQIFNIEGTTVKEGLSWMLMFAYCLILFIFLIWLITREGVAVKNLSVLHWIFFGGLTLMWLLSLFYIFGWWPFN